MGGQTRWNIDVPIFFFMMIYMIWYDNKCINNYDVKSRCVGLKGGRGKVERKKNAGSHNLKPYFDVIPYEIPWCKESAHVYTYTGDITKRKLHVMLKR